THGLTRRGLLAGGVSLAALAACSRPASTATSVAHEDFVIGANLELTGVGAERGKRQEQALRIAAAELNATGISFGEKRLSVRVVVRDNSTNPATAGQVSRDL